MWSGSLLIFLSKQKKMIKVLTLLKMLTRQKIKSKHYFHRYNGAFFLFLRPGEREADPADNGGLREFIELILKYSPLFVGKLILRRISIIIFEYNNWTNELLVWVFSCLTPCLWPTLLYDVIIFVDMNKE